MQHNHKQGRVIGLVLLAAVLLAWSLAAASSEPALPDGQPDAALPASGSYQLRLIYFIPSNRTPQPSAASNLQTYVLNAQQFFAEQMARLGYGPKTLTVETEVDGQTPKVNVVFSSQPDSQFHDPLRGARWSKVLQGIKDAGYPPWQEGELLLVIAEMHLQNADGSFAPQTLFFGGAGSEFAGVGLITGEPLARFDPALLTSNQPYHGLVLPGAGPFPLVQGVSYGAFSGTTFSSISSAAQGGALHELGHGLRLPHDFRNDRNFNGNLMGNGLRGIRGYIHPELYPDDFTRLSAASARKLNHSRFFNPAASNEDVDPPLVTVLDHGLVRPQGGLVQVRFRAEDADSELAGAVLLRAGRVVDDGPLQGKVAQSTLRAYDYTPGVAENWRVVVFDTAGNQSDAPLFSLTPEQGHNRAPIPFVELNKAQAWTAEMLQLSAERSRDPDGSSADLLVEWDTDGDGEFDTLPSTSKLLNLSYDNAGVYQVIARLTDAQGDSSVSMPLGLRIEARNEPPLCSQAVPDVASLWPPNHKFVDVAIDVPDPDGDVVNLEIFAVMQDEPVTGKRAGRTSPDAVIAHDANLLLRAERAGRGNGRVYHISFRATDAQGASCVGDVQVTVDHNRRSSGAVDDGARYDSTQH